MNQEGVILSRLGDLKEDCGEIKTSIQAIEGHQRLQNDKLIKHETTLFGETGLCEKVNKNSAKIDINKGTIVKLSIGLVALGSGLGVGGSELIHLVGG